MPFRSPKRKWKKWVRKRESLAEVERKKGIDDLGNEGENVMGVWCA